MMMVVVVMMMMMLLRILGAWCKSPNNRIRSYKGALRRTGYKSIEATVRTRRLLWAGALLRVGDHRLPKRVMPGDWRTRNNNTPSDIIRRSPYVWRMGGLTRDGAAEPVSRDQILRRERTQGNIHSPCSAGHEQDWQPYQVDLSSARCD